MINVRMQPQEVQKLSPKITVVGVGGAGGNAVNNMIASNLEGVEFLVCNTDAQALDGAMAEHKLQMGVTVTGGLGAGARPDIGRAAAEESLDEVIQYLDEANMVFITAGMGGGTGSGAAPVIAKACRERGILTVGVVTKPFHFEGTLRMKMAEEAISEMQDYVDTLIVIPNQNLFRVANEKTTFAEAFKMADGVLQSGVRGVTDLIVMPGLINLDFADIRSAMTEMGKAMMGTGEATGERRAVEAAEAAINNPLLDDVSMKGARGVIINITGGYDMTLFEADEACNRIRDEVDPNANIIFGSTFDENLEGTMRVSVVATGIESVAEKKSRTQNQGVFERAKPRIEESGASAGEGTNAPSVRPATASGGQQSATGGYHQAMRAPQTPSAPYSPRQMEEPKGEEPEAELFEQQEFEARQGEQAATGTGGNVSPDAAMRGTRFRDAFIPPRPVEPEQGQGYARGAEQSQASMQPQHSQRSSQPQGYGATQARPLTGQPGESSGYGPQRGHDQEQGEPSSDQGTRSGLNLAPPVPGASRRKSPSLFERITGHGRTREEEHSDEPAATGDGQQETGSGLRAPQKPSQGRLNIENPSQSSDNGEDELDIPAFLRRQAN